MRKYISIVVRIDMKYNYDKYFDYDFSTINRIYHNDNYTLSAIVYIV